MRSLNLQFFLLFGSFAAVQPFVALLLKDRGMDMEQIGYAMGVSGWAIMLSPALITLIADTRMQPRRLLAGLGAVSSAAVVAMLLAESHVVLVAAYFVYSLASTAMIPLQDGIVFGYQRMLVEEGREPIQYNKVRVWGTYGYMALLGLLFYPMRRSDNVEIAFVFAIGCIAAMSLNALSLPDRGRRETAKRAQGLPTSEAAKTLLGGRAILFTLGMFLLLGASAAYHTMYPVYLVEDMGIAKHWIGIVIMSGALGEVFYIHALGGLERRFGARAVMLAGVVLTVVRFGLLYAIPLPSVAVGTQILHGAMICSMMVIPPTYLNALANDSSRNSIQGVYTMLVVGGSRFVGTALAGHVALVGQREVHLLSLGLTAAALALLWRGFRVGT